MSMRSLFLVAAVSAAALGHLNPARASSLALNCTEYASSAVPAGCTTGAAPSMLSTPGAYTYGNASLLPASSSGGIITGSAYPSGYTGASFYDAYVFTIGNSQGDSISSTINLGNAFQISNFEERLYTYTGTAPNVGAISGALDFWALPAGSTGTVAVLPSTVLAAGTYVLEVRGDVTGSSGGSYAGTLQLSPVPLPAAVWLLLSGIVGLVLVGFARSSALRPTAPGLTFA